MDVTKQLQHKGLDTKLLKTFNLLQFAYHVTKYRILRRVLVRKRNLRHKPYKLFTKKTKEETKMALQKCPECNHNVSTEAESCPQCGHPIRAKKITVAGPVDQVGLTFWGVVGAIIVAIILISLC